MPLHQISVIPRDVTSSRVSGSGKAKDKDKQVCEELKAKSGHALFRPGTQLRITGWFYPIKCVIYPYVEFLCAVVEGTLNSCSKVHQ